PDARGGAAAGDGPAVEVPIFEVVVDERVGGREREVLRPVARVRDGDVRLVARVAALLGLDREGPGGELVQGILTLGVGGGARAGQTADGYFGAGHRGASAANHPADRAGG